MKIGDKFGRWTVTSDTFVKRDSGGTPRYKIHVRCECGTEAAVDKSHLKRHRTRSCGCINHEITSARSLKHGESHTKLYKAWEGMHTRCHDKRFKVYAGRGIAVCNAWEKYEAFRDWSTVNGYQDGLTLDRKDNDKGYSPENCRWATSVTQSQNKRKLARNTSGYIGVSRDSHRWKAQVSHSNHTFNLGRYDTPEEAAHVRDDYVREHYESPTLNFPDEGVKP